MPGTGHKAWLYLSTDSVFTAVNELECQISLAINQSAESIDLSHKNSDTKIFGVGSNTIELPFGGRIEIAAEQGDPTNLATQLLAFDVAFQAGTLIYVEVRLSLIKGTTLATTDRFRRYSGILQSFNWDFPDEDAAGYDGVLSARAIEAL